MPQVQYIDEVVDVPLVKHRPLLKDSLYNNISIPPQILHECWLERQVPVPVKQQKHVEASSLDRFSSFPWPKILHACKGAPGGVCGPPH